MVLSFLWLYITCNIEYDGNYISNVAGPTPCSIQSETPNNNIVGFKCNMTNIVDIADFSNFMSILTIPNSLFDSRNRLKQLILPPNIKSIGDYSFRQCSLETITFPTSLISIGDYSFYKCSTLKGPIDFKNVQTLGNNAFFGVILLRES